MASTVSNVSQLTFNIKENDPDLKFSVILNGFEKQSKTGKLKKEKFIELFNEIILNSEGDFDYLSDSKLKNTRKLISTLKKKFFIIDQKMESKIRDHSCVECYEKPFLWRLGKSHLVRKFYDSSNLDIAKEAFVITELFQEILVFGNKKKTTTSIKNKKVEYQNSVYCRLGLKVVIRDYASLSKTDLVNIRDSIIRVCEYWQSELDNGVFQPLKKGKISQDSLWKIGYYPGF